ncbi:Major facilitator superfamily domain-containing protein 10 AltName: Full=Tetracycline transporter-like protein [Rhizoctonia solani AG-1 IB]|uniref:Rhizoctonia solani AG1-IB WGS project CAOJ00000000 data, isolate 7/3/14, contig 03191 n=1 Tax=Thanatephorus cucumeris (strain AG1-IB / isolate 7/3/14) TaxID=1108050 RepID=M5BK20_THACB|nr:Major facilitator superfamily domain-containing protein 10 AltName: Full=Tetracycline transporter-like protein [Rhizoctonia solani AG-1 IB]
MVGNILSAIVWIQSTSFASFLLARAIGGISEGNVQLSIAMLSDITPPARRSAALMFIGIAFSICFTIGPPIGAYFSIHPFPLSFTRDMNIYATPAILTLVLLLIETAFLAAYLPETRGAALIEEEGDETVRDRYKKLPLGERRALLKRLGGLHFSFLSLFSGVEFTLTFLTFDLLDWNNSQNGRLLGLIGVFSALLQGGYVRRATSKVGESAFARRGMCDEEISAKNTLSTTSTSPSHTEPEKLAKTGVTETVSASGVSSAHNNITPVNNPNKISTGRALGEFRSSGQLGRAIGPLLACIAYWTVGPSVTYSATAIAMCALIWRTGIVMSSLRRADGRS